MPDRHPPRSGRIPELLGRHPRWAMALRAAAAATIAWYVVRLLPGPAAQYPYYAPMGAVIATSTTLAGSIRESLQSVASIALGGLIGVTVYLLGRPEHPVLITVAMAIGVMAAGWPPLGSMGAWVPTSALFTLIIGRGEMSYVTAYAGLVLLGAAIGVGVVALTPPLPLAPAREAVDHVRTLLSTQLQALADVLDGPQPPGAEEWDRHRRNIAPYLATMRTEVAQAKDATMVNPRARKHVDAIDALRHQSQELDRIATLTQQLAYLLAATETREADVPALGPELRPSTATVLRHLASALDTFADPAAHHTAVRDARQAVANLVERTERSRRPDLPLGGIVAASTVIMAVRQCLDTIDPDIVHGHAP